MTNPLTPAEIEGLKEPPADELLPCPFCGGDAQITEAEECGPNAFVVSCPDCDACSRVKIAAKDCVRRELIQLWNKREFDPRLIAAAEREGKARELLEMVSNKALPHDPSHMEPKGEFAKSLMSEWPRNDPMGEWSISHDEMTRIRAFLQETEQVVQGSAGSKK